MSFETNSANSYTESTEMEHKPSRCSWLQLFHKKLSLQFYNLGFLVAQWPSYFIIVPVFIALLAFTGLQSMKYEKDPEYLFSPSNSRGRDERKIVESLYPVNYSHHFDPSRITRISPFARLLITAKDNETILRTQLWKDIMKLDATIQNITVTWQEDVYNYKDVCAIWMSECIQNKILDLNEVMPEIENGTRHVDYPLMLFPFIIPLFYGGADVNETEGYAKSIHSIVLHYWLKADDWKQEARSYLFEEKILNYLEKTDFESIKVARFVSKSLENELDRNTSYIISYLPPTVFVMIVFTIICVMMSDWVRSKIYVSIMGIVTAGLGTACSFGLLIYCQVPFIGINVAAPFLLVGIGIDDMFVVLSAWHRTPIQDTVPRRLAQTYSEAAVSITITSLTNTLSFFIGAITPFPSVYIFCIYTGVAILLTYLFFITFFGACLAIAGYQEKKQLHGLTCQPALAKSEATGSSWMYRMFCTGGISETNQWNPRDNRPHILMIFFRDYVSKALNTPIIKGLVILSFVLYLAGAIYGCLQVKEGLEKHKLALYESYLTDYYAVENADFKKFPYRIQVIINANLTYSNPQTRRQILRLHKSFENLPFMHTDYTESWVRSFYKFLRRTPRLQKTITDEKSFIKVLKQNYLRPDMPETLDIVFNEDESRILSSRFVVQAVNIQNTNEDRDMMLSLRQVADEAPFEVVTYFPLFVFFDQFVLVAPLTMQTISLVAFVMMIVSFLFIPNPFCCLWVIFSIISIEVGVMGYMALWDVSLDCISMINLIMCIGFSVDFSAHISYAYLTANVESSEERVKECLFNLGLPVLQSGLSTIVGVFVFVVAPSNIFRTFFKIICLVIIFGTMHALLLLPVMLSLLGPGSCSKRSKKVSLSKAISHIADNVPKNIENGASFRVDKISDLSTPVIRGNISKEPSSYASSSTGSLRYGNDDSDTESTRASSRSQDLDEYETGRVNLSYMVDEIESQRALPEEGKVQEEKLEIKKDNINDKLEETHQDTQNDEQNQELKKIYTTCIKIESEGSSATTYL